MRWVFLRFCFLNLRVQIKKQNEETNSPFAPATVSAGDSPAGGAVRRGPDGSCPARGGAGRGGRGGGGVRAGRGGAGLFLSPLVYFYFFLFQDDDGLYKNPHDCTDFTELAEQPSNSEVS